MYSPAMTDRFMVKNTSFMFNTGMVINYFLTST